MCMVAKVVSVMETVLGPMVEEFAEQRNLIQRKRKFCGQSLLRMLVFTLLKKPDATFADMAFTAAQLGVDVSAMAVEKRFTQPLIGDGKKRVRKHPSTVAPPPPNIWNCSAGHYS